MQYRADRSKILRPGRLRGIALVTVISVMLILVVVTTGFTAFTTQDMKTSQTTYEQAQTYCLAEAGIDYGLFLVKHSMLIYPNPPTVTGWRGHPMVTDANFSSNPLYDATNGDLDGIDSTHRNTYGQILNLSKGGQEFVMVSDLSYTPPASAAPNAPNNWMTPVRYCGTFLVKYSLGTVSGQSAIQLTSTGYIKIVPGTVNLSTATDYNDSTSTSGAQLQSWTVVAQRTLNCDVLYNTSGGTGTVKVVRFFEKFR